MARMTMDELTCEPDYAALTTKQQNFLKAYLQGFLDRKTFDVTAAVLASYTCRSRESARVHGAHLLAKPGIQSCVARFLGQSIQQNFQQALLRAINNPKLTVAQKDALELFAKTFVKPESKLPDDDERRFKIGEKFEQDGTWYEVVVKETTKS